MVELKGMHLADKFPVLLNASAVEVDPSPRRTSNLVVLIWSAPKVYFAEKRSYRPKIELRLIDTVRFCKAGTGIPSVDVCKVRRRLGVVEAPERTYVTSDLKLWMKIKFSSAPSGLFC